ncbi:hypothetical protein N431DRAFT_546711 [Stipitochalara longipes BDJ]|nr:hypothetical protein N431DRAFT_546711 [Stipitochalara longipes BDJ]
MHSTLEPVYTQDDLVRLREHLQGLLQHVKDTTETTAQQEAAVNQIRAQFELIDSSEAEIVENQNQKEQHEAFAMEEYNKLDETAKHQDEADTQIQGIGKGNNKILSQKGEQGQSSEADLDALLADEQGSADNLLDPQDITSDEGPSIQDILHFQLNQTQQQLNDLEAEMRAARRQHREKMRFEGLAGAKIFPALDENSDASESAALETELLDTTDEMQGQVLVSLLSPKERLDIDMLFEEPDEALSQTSAQFSPLQAASQVTNEDDNQQGGNAPISHQGYNRAVDEEMVYGDENSEDLIDWTPDDEFDLNSYPPASVQTTFTPVAPAQFPLPPQHSPVAPINQANDAPAQPQSDITNQHHDEALNQPWDDLARPLSSPTLPTTSLDSLKILYTPHEDDSSQEYSDKLNALETLAQQEYGKTLVDWEDAKILNETTKQRDSALASLEQTRGELEHSRRDLATRTGERNGARQRIAILEDEVKEREMKELQLREELRLEREEDPLADKLFVELEELRRRFEEAEEAEAKALAELTKLYEEANGRRAVAERDLAVMQQHLTDAETMMREQRERLKDLEWGADQDKAHAAELERKLSIANDKWASMTATVFTRDAKIEGLNAQLVTLRAEIEQLTAQLVTTQQELDEAKSPEADTDTINAQQAEIEGLKAQLGNAKGGQDELNQLTAELQNCQQSLSLSRSQQQSSHTTLQHTKASLSTAEIEIHNLSSQLQEASTALALARTEARNAVAAAEQARDEAVESRRALGAANDMGHRLRRISSENIRELVEVKEERDAALHDVWRLTRDLAFADEEVRRVRQEVQELEANNQVLSGRYVEAERRAGEYGRQALDCEERVEDLQRLVETLSDIAVDLEAARVEDGLPPSPMLSVEEEVSPRSPVSPISPVMVGEERDSPTLFVGAAPKPREEPVVSGGESSERVIPPERRGTRKTRNPRPVYVEPSSPDSPTAPRKGSRKRRRVQGDEDEHGDLGGKRK